MGDGEDGLREAVAKTRGVDGVCCHPMLSRFQRRKTIGMNHKVHVVFHQTFFSGRMSVLLVAMLPHACQ